MFGDNALVTCPYCWETIELLLDLSAGSQVYSEDCPVCCHPMTVQLQVDADNGGYVVEVDAESR